jgi:hypothetical protein
VLAFYATERSNRAPAEHEETQMTTIVKVLAGFASVGSGRWCRCCSKPIQVGDGFGMAEAVCGPCRHAVGSVYLT